MASPPPANIIVFDQIELTAKEGTVEQALEELKKDLSRVCGLPDNVMTFGKLTLVSGDDGEPLHNQVRVTLPDAGTVSQIITTTYGYSWAGKPQSNNVFKNMEVYAVGSEEDPSSPIYNPNHTATQDYLLTITFHPLSAPTRASLYSTFAPFGPLSSLSLSPPTTTAPPIAHLGFSTLAGALAIAALNKEEILALENKSAVVLVWEGGWGFPKMEGWMGVLKGLGVNAGDVCYSSVIKPVKEKVLPGVRLIAAVKGGFYAELGSSGTAQGLMDAAKDHGYCMNGVNFSIRLAGIWDGAPQLDEYPFDFPLALRPELRTHLERLQSTHPDKQPWITSSGYLTDLASVPEDEEDDGTYGFALDEGDGDEVILSTGSVRDEELQELISRLNAGGMDEPRVEMIKQYNQTKGRKGGLGEIKNPTTRGREKGLLGAGISGEYMWKDKEGDVFLSRWRKGDVEREMGRSRRKVEAWVEGMVFTEESGRGVPDLIGGLEKRRRVG